MASMRSQAERRDRRALHLSLGHGLAERDGRGLDDAAAGVAVGRVAGLGPQAANLVILEALAAGEALAIAHGAVDFDELVLGDAAELVQAVDILGDDAD